MWQKSLLLGNKNRNIDAVYSKRARFTPASHQEIIPGDSELGYLCINKDGFSVLMLF